ncbi:HtaA domain-containing protein [Streptomyces bacillaris]|uniref:HtaA domain-containing protein n=1 Tax=Streptomyces bacillaris TaxID=68179 RepID=UPI00382DD481
MAATRRPIALAAAVATAAALGATFALPAFADSAPSKGPAAAAAPKLDLTDGTLDWGFKESFRKYLAMPFAHGKITVSDGAKQAENNGVFTFVDGKGSYDTGTHATDTAFKGSVNFYAHDGALDITLSDVKLSTTRTGGAITADVKTPQGTTDDVDIATLDLSTVRPGQGDGGAMVFKDIPATLTKAGSEAFNGQYKEGDALDPATLSVKAVTPPTSQPTEQPTGQPTEQPTGRPTEQPTGQPTGKPSTEPTPTPTETAAKPTSGPVVDGTLDWGVKKSFRSYVVGPIAHGKVETTDGASANAEGYRFTKATGHLDAEKNSLNAQFKGKVRFLGHETAGDYKLDLSLSNLKVDVQGTTGKLVADVSTKDMASGKVNTFTGLAFADLKVPAGALAAKEGVVNLKAIPATLTEDGSKAFSNMYKKGDELDALTAAVSLDKDATLPPGGSTEYKNCAEAEAAGVTPIKKGDPGYAAHLDRDGDGIACEAGESTGGSGSTGGSTTGGGTVGGSTTGGSTAGGSVGGSGALASTGSDVPTGLLIGASGLVVAAGAGVMIAARRRRNASDATA